MVVIQLRQDLLHDRLTVKDCLCPYPELLTITINGSHLTVIQIDNLPMLTHQSLLLLLQIFRIDSR